YLRLSPKFIRERPKLTINLEALSCASREIRRHSVLGTRYSVLNEEDPAKPATAFDLRCEPCLHAGQRNELRRGYVVHSAGHTLRDGIGHAGYPEYPARAVH